jgi:type I restriction enzyme, S subunit
VNIELTELPSSWNVMGLGDICKTTSGGTPSRTRSDYYGGSIPWVKSGELCDGIVYGIEETISEEGLKNSSAKIFKKGSLLIALYGATVGKLGILSRDAATNQAVCGIFPSEHIETKYLFWYLRSIRSDLIDKGQGGAQPNISQGIVKDIQIPLAPPTDQQRIVSEIEKQFSRLDEAVALLKRIQANLKRYKAAVLKAAVEGKLTEQWRKEHPDVELADQLLKRILAERRAKWEADELAKMKAKGVKPKDDLWKKKYKEPAGPDKTNLPELPVGWVWATIGQLANIMLGKMLDKTKHRSGQKLAYLRNVNIRWGRIDTDDMFEMFFKDDELERYGLINGDVLVCEGGEPGRSAVWNGQLQGMKYQKALHRVRFGSGYEPRLIVALLEYLAKSGRLEEWFTGCTIKHFTKESFTPLPAPLSPLAEQLMILAEIDRRLSVTEELETTIITNLKRAERLRQTILQQAFSGGMA